MKPTPTQFAFLRFSLISLFLCTALSSATQLPVFYPETVRITNPTYERIGDMTFGQNTFALLEVNQNAVILVGRGVREVIPLPYDDARYIEYGNGVFVVIGSRGSISRSTDLHHWDHYHWDGTNILPGPHDLPGNVVTVNNLLSLKYHPDHRHFFVETSNGDVWISPNGANWSVWQDGTSAPETLYPQISDTVAIFEQDGRFLKFERTSGDASIWQVYQSMDGDKWTADGQLASRLTPGKVYYRDGTWLGIVGSTCFLNVGSSWEVEGGSGYPSGFPAAFSRGRYHHNQILGIRDGYLSEYKNGYWTPLVQTSADALQYLPKLDRFFLLDYSDGTVDATYDGTEVFRVFESENFLPERIAEHQHYLVIVGRDLDNEPVVWSSEGPVSWETGISSDYPVNFIDGGSSIDWSSYPYPEQPRSARLTSDWDYFYLATGYNLYQSTDGLQWEQVFEVDPDTASWITALYEYRGKTWVATTNYAQASHLYVPPPEGIEPQNTLYSRSYMGEDWEQTIVDDQIFVANPSLDGPYLMEYLYGFPSSTVTFAEKGESVERRWAPWISTDGTLVWAYGRYYLFQGNSVAKTHFLGFKDADYFRQVEASEDYDGSGSLPAVTTDTGYFGSLTIYANGYEHSTLGAIDFREKPGTDGVLYLFSDRWGVLEMNLANAPYAYSPVDGTTYYVNFYAPSDPNFDNDSPYYSPFYNHTTGQWGKRLTCEGYSFDQWFEILQTQQVKVRALANELIGYVVDGALADAYSRKATLEAELAILESFRWPSLANNSDVDAATGSERFAKVDAAIVEGEKAVIAATEAFDARYAVIP